MEKANCRILVTGANGFIGKNLVAHLKELPNTFISTFVRGDEIDLLPSLVSKVDAVIHLAGENRPLDQDAYMRVNEGLTSILCDIIRRESDCTGRRVPLILASSIHADLNTPYGQSKLAAERLVRDLSENTENPVAIFRLPGVFGKWCKPNYNSVVATFCHNMANGLPIQIKDPLANLRLVYVDDVIAVFLNWLQSAEVGLTQGEVQPEYSINLGDLAAQIKAFSVSRGPSLQIEPVGSGFLRALYATYMSYLPSNHFVYEVPQYFDQRGVFVEMIKTNGFGQFSYFTALPGVTRGGHYHHTKSEKFLVVKGSALFRFRHLLTNELYELETSGDKSQIVDTIPGWVHDITNVGNEEMVVMLWASENFDRLNPDTVASKI